MRLSSPFLLCLPLALALVACNDTFDYTGFQTNLVPGYDHTVSVDSGLTKPVRFEALMVVRSAPLVMTIVDPAGQTSVITVPPGRDAQVVSKQFTDSLGHWSVRIQSQGEGRVRIKLHTRNEFEGFSDDERRYVLAAGQENHN